LNWQNIFEKKVQKNVFFPKRSIFSAKKDSNGMKKNKKNVELAFRNRKPKPGKKNYWISFREMKYFSQFCKHIFYI
jgi:hypothetical protein